MRIWDDHAGVWVESPTTPSQSIRDLIFHTRGMKDGAIQVSRLSQFGLNEFRKKTQEFIAECETAEIKLYEQLENVSNPPPSYL